MPEIRMPTDDLRVKLDKLAEKIVDGVADDPDATRRELTEALKTVSQWWSSSRKGDTGEPPENAWDRYKRDMTGGKTNGKTHQA